MFLLAILSHARSYDSKLAKVAAFASDAAYTTPTNLERWNCQSCKNIKLEDIRVLSDNSYDFQMYMGINTGSKEILIAYRGSSNIKNWIQNLKINLVPYPGCKCMVHYGFLQIQDKIKKWVLTNVNDLIGKYGSMPISITGHSLGGAIATLSALDLHNSGLKVADVYTFGQPHVGDKEFAVYVQSKIKKFRVVHNKDVVPHVPPFPVYYQPSTEIWYSEDMHSYRECSATNGQDLTCSEGILPFELNTEDHSMSEYLSLKEVHLTQE